MVPVSKDEWMDRWEKIEEELYRLVVDALRELSTYSRVIHGC